jgi:hypothetical protein
MDSNIVGDVDMVVNENEIFIEKKSEKKLKSLKQVQVFIQKMRII